LDEQSKCIGFDDLVPCVNTISSPEA